MNPTVETIEQTTPFHSIAAGDFENTRNKANGEEIYYPTSQGEEMGETTIHSELIANLMQMLRAFFAGRENVFIAGNLNVYYEENFPNKWFAPDVLVCFGVENHARRIFKVWEENQFPQIIFEIASDSTFETDLGEKYGEYNRLGAEEYYLLDPERSLLPQPLMAFQREGERLQLVNAKERVFSPRLGLEIVDTGETFRLFDPNSQKFLLTLEEAQAEIKRLQELLNQK
jgi:Uma2 family endonuclease